MNEDKRKRIITILKGVFFLLIIAGIPAYLYFFQRELLLSFKRVEDIEVYILARKGYGAVIYVLAQVLQMVIAIIPGQPFQFAAGYIFGTGIALLLSIIGAILGEMICYYLAKLLGRDAVCLFFGKTKAVSYLERLDSPNGLIVLFLLYFIPGFPKDTVSYLAGLSRLRCFPFVVIATVARILPILGSIVIGSFTKAGKFEMVIAVAIIVVTITALCYKKKERFLDFSEKVYDKLNHQK